MNVLVSKIIEIDRGYKHHLDFLGDEFSADAIKNLLRSWCREGLEEDKSKNKKIATHFLVVKNSSVNMNFPVFIYNKDDLKEISQKYHKNNDYLVIAIYDLEDTRNQDKDLDQKKKESIS